MTFSVIIPCYNCEKTLETTVDSIRMSGLTDYEIILIDDGSTDGTAQLCDKLCSMYKYIRCIHQENAGVSAARNRGIDEAQGEYVWFVDSDDTMIACALNDAVKILSEYKPDMFIFGLCFDYYRNQKLYRSDSLVPPFNGMLTQDCLKEHYMDFYNQNMLTPVWNKFIRRDLIKKNNIRFHKEMILMEDYLFVIDVLQHIKSIYSYQKVIYRYRQSEDENGAYRRLQRISDLADYMKPFEESIKLLGISAEVITELYKMLLGQKLYYASYKQIQEIISEHKQNRYAFINMGNPLSIYLRNKKTQLRHKIAVVVKSSRIYQRYK
jgi:glycosyltransferase involved in cell wall biosynthesis